MKLQFTYRALHDLKRLRRFIADKNPPAAQRMSQRLRHSITSLLDNPKVGRQLEELTGVRELINGAYIVRYTETTDTIIILNIWHGKEDR